MSGAAPPRRRRSARHREGRQFVTHNVLAAAGTWGAGVFGLLLQALVSHHFKPAEYGEAFAVFSFFTILTQPSYGFGRLITWSTSRARAARLGEEDSSALLRQTNARLLVGGTVLALLFIGIAPHVAAYLHVPATFIVLGSLGLPFLIGFPPLLASLQGEERWVSWSLVSIVVALSRVACVLVLVIPFGVSGILLGISAAAALVYFGLLIMVWPRMRRAGKSSPGWRPQWRFLLLSLASGVTVSVTMGSDVVMVQHFFGSHAGGQFGSVAVTTRGLYFAFGSVGSVLFPKVAARHATARSTRWIVIASVGVSVLGAVVGFAAFSAGGHAILHYFSGRAYEGGASYIGWYAVGMPLLAAVTMLTQTQQSLSDLGLLYVLVPGTLLKPLLVFFFHQTLLMVSIVSDIAITALLAALCMRYLMWERRRADAAVQNRSPEKPAPGLWTTILRMAR